MKIGEIGKLNKKGQVVIPKKYRDDLGISEDSPLHIVKRGHGVYMYPIKDVVDSSEELNDAAYTQVLKKTQGMWSGDTWEETSAKQADTEKKAAKKGKQPW